jgi:hypothetical protein
MLSNDPPEWVVYPFWLKYGSGVVSLPL